MVDFDFLEVLLAVAKRPVAPISQLRRAPDDFCVTKTIKSDVSAFVALDLMLAGDGSLRLIECNGSNSAGTSLGQALGDLPRAQHMVEAAAQRIASRSRAAVVFGVDASSVMTHEHAERARLVTELIKGTRPARLAHSEGAAQTSDDVLIVFDEIPKLADRIHASFGRLFFDDREIVLAGNPNLLPELHRRGILERDGDGYQSDGQDVDVSVYHDGILLPLVFDKLKQQKVAGGTGIEPQLCADCYTLQECEHVVENFWSRGMTCVLKMNCGSGGTGVEILPPTLSRGAVADRLRRLMGAAQAKYGDVAKTLWPIRAFQFCESTKFDINHEPHVWDTRIACYVSPNKVEMRLGALRICPQPFDPKLLNREALVSNTSGRKPSVEFLRTPLVVDGGPSVDLQAVGVTNKVFLRMFESAASWCEKAIQNTY